jgi:hypothetical protein
MHPLLGCPTFVCGEAHQLRRIYQPALKRPWGGRPPQSATTLTLRRTPVIERPSAARCLPRSKAGASSGDTDSHAVQRRRRCARNQMYQSAADGSTQPHSARVTQAPAAAFQAARLQAARRKTFAVTALACGLAIFAANGNTMTFERGFGRVVAARWRAGR